MGIYYELTDADITSKSTGLNIINMTLNEEHCYREKRKNILALHLDKFELRF